MAINRSLGAALVLLTVLSAPHSGARGALAVETPVANAWQPLEAGTIGPKTGPALFWAGNLQRFVVAAGNVSHDAPAPRPYDVLSLDLAAGVWHNDLPPGAEKRGGLTGPVMDPGFSMPFYILEDKDGIARPQPQQAILGNQFAYAPWDGMLYALVCGRTLRYDPAKRVWQDMAPLVSPTVATRGYKTTLNWGAMCADPVRREIVLFGGCGLDTPTAGPGTWIYSPLKNAWQQVATRVQPPPRAYAPMAFDAGSGKIVLFGGDGLDRLYADTWVFDSQTRSWEERRPALGPSPRFGHALVHLPAAGKVLLVGGKGYTSSTSYQARLYQALPWEMWTYDVAADAWSLLQRMDEGAPPQPEVHPTLAAADDADRVLLVTRAGSAKTDPGSTWLCRVDAALSDAAGTEKYGVKPGTLDYRTGPYDPDWYEQDVPPVDRAATAAVLASLPANRWMSLECPKWPANRMGGGWSTVALDVDRDQILHLGGGHSSYFGNDVAHYDIATGRWSISYRPQFALDYNYDLSGPGAFAFNLGPWGNHNYHCYTYDPIHQRLVYLRGMSQMYDPTTRSWSYAEKFPAPFEISKYTTYLCPTPQGVVAWTRLTSSSSEMGLLRLEKGQRWVTLPVSGDPLPVTVTDGSTIVYDSRRDQLLMTTTPGSGNDPRPVGQVWSYDLKSGAVKKLDPAGRDQVVSGRFAREAVYLPGMDKVLLGYHLGGKNITPFYDVPHNRWLTAEIPGAEFYLRSPVESGTSVDLGLVYDPKRDLVWGVMCKLTAAGALNVLRLDEKTLPLKPIQ